MFSYIGAILPAPLWMFFTDPPRFCSEKFGVLRCLSFGLYGLVPQNLVFYPRPSRFFSLDNRNLVPGRVGLDSARIIADHRLKRLDGFFEFMGISELGRHP